MTHRTAAHYATQARLTERQLKVMHAIADGCAMPAQIRHRLGLKTHSALDNHLLALEAKWLIARAPSGVVSLTARGIERLAEEAVAA